MQSTETSSAENDFGDLPPVSAEQKIAELEAALLQVRDDQLRERAELDNQRKRLVRDVDQARKFANERLLEALLPVLDNLERGLEAAGTDYAVLREGVDLTLRQFQKVVEDHGLVAVEGTGSAFNPEHHQAVSVAAASETHPADTVVAAMQKGYLLNGRLLRPALVVVAK